MMMLMLIAGLGGHAAFAQSAPQGDIWRAYAQKIEAGTRVKIHMDDGQRIAATLIEASADGLLIQPRTRVPVPVQRVAYDRITSLQRDEARGIGAGKAVALGVGSGVGAFFGIMLVLIAAMD
jgi:hypothetical protein